ncbi:hypothetical protein MLD38_001886 [Melastoma candidum]|uniref:Uncharacterized protein n=1 Tax=Melastoma candidum TaxID=119954 RepID=A0ACB9SE48_9MYRT|nr:hypothetical protein MLD38_001886 [Melastoma candidum]
MHSRHQRNPGNGYRSGPMGGSNMAAGSHASPEGPSRGPGFYKSENRNFNRTFSRNQGQTHQRNFHRPPAAPPTSARADVFMEMGKLAAEYLVSQGVLPPSVLPAKWQNGSLMKPSSEFQDFRPHDEENLQYAGEARTSALARLSNTGFDGGPGRRKYNDDYGTTGPRNYMRGKRKGGSSRNYGSDWGREYGRSGSWSERNRDRNSPNMDLDQDSSYRRREEHPFGKDSGDRRAANYDSGSRYHEDEQLGKDDERIEFDRDTRSKCNEEQLFGKGCSDMSDLTGLSATPPKGTENKDSESDIKGKKLLEELSEMKDSDVVNDIQEMASGEIKTESVDLVDSQQMSGNNLRISREETEDDSRSMGEIKESRGETLKEIISQDLIPEHLAEPTSLSENSGADLKALCKFTNVPTRIRSSLANGPKGRPVLSHEGIGLTGPIEVMVVDRNLSVSINDGSFGGCDKPNVPDLKMPKVKSPRVIEEERSLHSDDAMVLAREVESGNSLGDGKPDSAPLPDQATTARPEPLEDGMLENVQSLNPECQGSMCVDPVVEKRGEKRPHGGIDMDGQHVRRKETSYLSTRDWLAPTSVNTCSCSSITNPVIGEINQIDDSLPVGKNTTTVSQGSTIDNFQLPEGLHKPGFVDNTEEKQFFPSSFKICDLNLMESSNAHENNDRDPIFMYPSVSAVKKNDSPIDIDLSIYNSVKSVESSTNMVGGRGIEIIDLDVDSAPEEKTLSVNERRTEAEFMGLEGFSTSAPNAADIPDSQDGYGLMISELLANDFPGVTSVPGDINPLDNTGIQGPLADDDSIYMSLGEIPFLSFLRNWENPAPQEDGKPF